MSSNVLSSSVSTRHPREPFEPGEMAEGAREFLDRLEAKPQGADHFNPSAHPCPGHYGHSGGTAWPMAVNGSVTAQPVLSRTHCTYVLQLGPG
jgi:hypothetical protein